ncbi:S-adenosylmethionine:tRNA ribosyltransferase-isomerase [Spirochaetia bacterium]|nr:S-adenosylmethionine:tRNA ribosyltransferase-isomerase [Spirochaetia bacterium]
MKLTDFSFDLPAELIAQFPPAERGQSRLLVLDRSSKNRNHHYVKELPDLLPPGSLLVFNNSKVRKARLRGCSIKTGAEVEFLLIKKIDAFTWEAMARRAKKRRIGDRFIFAEGSAGETEAEISGGDNEFRRLRFDRPINDDWLEVYGHIPLPPYIRRDDTETDAERYQTIYAQKTGSQAAPTAGLHFTPGIMQALKDRNIECVFITLHVGLGTFLPVRTVEIEDHRMHEEVFFIDDDTAAAVEKASREGRKIIAVGTTSLRTLESAWELNADSVSGDRSGKLRTGENSTSIFIYPGYQFKIVDALFTNFHTPQSTLLMLAAAFAGRDLILETYAEAVRQGYRFFSYGDAMLIV